MMLETQEQRTEGMKRQAQELIDQAYQRGFKAGQELVADRENELIEQGIEQGRNEAWEAAGELVATEYWKVNGVLSDGVLDIKNDKDIFTKLTASEAIEKMKAWEQKQEQQEDEPQEFNSCDECVHSNDSEEKCIDRRCVHAIKTMDCFEKRQDSAEIRVGDEVEFVGYEGKGIVINNKTTYHRILVDDSVVSCHVGDLIPTGRYFPEIAQVLAKMKEGEGE